MNPLTRHRCYLAAAALLLILPCQAGEEPPPALAAADTGHPVAGWSRLRYAAGGMVGSVSTQLELADAAHRDMQVPPYTALANTTFQVATSPVMRLGIHVHTTTLFADSITEGTIWFDPGSGAVLQRDRLRPGWKGSRKIYRFGGAGASRIRLEPRDKAEAEQPSADWSKIKESYFPYDMTASGCKVVSDPILLLYLVSLPDYVNDSRSVQICTFFDDALYRVWLEPQGIERLEADYTVKSAGTLRKVSGRQETLKLLLRVEPVTAGADTSNFELLELRGTLAIHLDTRSRLPVRISGERAGFGRLSIGLVEAESQ